MPNNIARLLYGNRKYGFLRDRGLIVVMCDGVEFGRLKEYECRR